ncbi:MAG: hypothetical protein Q8Q40_02060 [Methylococcaceae bacterium]|nr:hypothetical protein [Methylococcaceae bacterium]MDP3902745.1 hypothetical protein [Methylococcaceae bacterium]
MSTALRFRKTQEREFFAHHMLLHAAEREIEEAQASAKGRFNKCLSAMVLSALAIEALANAVGSRVATDWTVFERLNPLEKLDNLARELSIAYDAKKEPWSAITQLARFRNDIAHPKPELVLEEKILPEVAIGKTLFDSPQSQIERQITLGNARRAHKAVCALKSILTDSLPEEKRFGIYVDMWSESTGLAE